jgi:FkbM family methyltransferase
MANDSTASFGHYALGQCHNTLLSFAQSRPVTWWGRRFALWSRKIVLVSAAQPIVDATVEGLKLRLYMNDNVSERKFLFLPQFFDAFERRLMKERLSEGSIFVDVGANAGIYSMTAAALVGASGRVVSVEPNPKVLERLKFNASLNGFENRVLMQQCGVSDSEGSFDLVMDDSNLGGSSLVMERTGDKISVRCEWLASIGHELGHGVIEAVGRLLNGRLRCARRRPSGLCDDSRAVV